MFQEACMFVGIIINKETIKRWNAYVRVGTCLTDGKGGDCLHLCCQVGVAVFLEVALKRVLLCTHRVSLQVTIVVMAQ